MVLGIVGFAGLPLLVLILRLRRIAAPRLTLEIATIIALVLGGVYLSWYRHSDSRWHPQPTGARTRSSERTDAQKGRISRSMIGRG